MHYSGMTARDLPPPSTLEADAARFRVPVFGFSPQPKLRRVGHGTTSAGNVIEEITISYTFIADPENPDDPDNLVEHVARIDAARLRAEQADQPAWFLQGLQDARYPVLTDAVATIAAGSGDPRTLAEHLADHINHVLINSIDTRRRQSADGIPTLDGGVRAGHAQGAELEVHNTTAPGLLIDSDPDVIGWAVSAGEALVLVALPRDRAEHIDRRLIRIAEPAAPPRVKNTGGPEQPAPE